VSVRPALTTASAGLAPAAGVRAFRLIVQPAPGQPGEGDRYGVRLEEAYSDGARTLTSSVATATPVQTARVIDSLVAAVRASGHQAGVLAPSRRKPIPLDEPSGVRLALTLLACQPLSKTGRIRQIVAGVAAMSVEETYYWYAKTVGPEADRVRRALRLFLAEE
jgi:hypothetical protein